LKFEIEELFRLVMLYTDTKKKHTHTIVKSIHSSFRSESKILSFNTMRTYIQQNNFSRIWSFLLLKQDFDYSKFFIYLGLF
ncbi:MAG: hypothetical protein ACRYE7_01855, partial [Janthinobacterium lividum]